MEYVVGEDNLPVAEVVGIVNTAKVNVARAQEAVQNAILMVKKLSSLSEKVASLSADASAGLEVANTYIGSAKTCIRIAEKYCDSAAADDGGASDAYASFAKANTIAVSRSAYSVFYIIDMVKSMFIAITSMASATAGPAPAHAPGPAAAAAAAAAAGEDMEAPAAGEGMEDDDYSVEMADLLAENNPPVGMDNSPIAEAVALLNSAKADLAQAQQAVQATMATFQKISHLSKMIASMSAASSSYLPTINAFISMANTSLTRAEEHGNMAATVGDANANAARDNALIATNATSVVHSSIDTVEALLSSVTTMMSAAPAAVPPASPAASPATAVISFEFFT